jgi:hypothetical protein
VTGRHSCSWLLNSIDQFPDLPCICMSVCVYFPQGKKVERDTYWQVMRA